MASGLKINLSKSKLFGFGVDHSNVASMASAIRCQVGSSPFSYLGLPVGSNMNRIASWAPVVERLKNRLSRWKALSLSLGGRLTLVKAVLGSLPIYFLSVFKAPVKVISQLEQIRRQFLWGFNNSSSKVSWVSWKQIMASKDVGGWGSVV
jgi:hypothetical protein